MIMNEIKFITTDNCSLCENGLLKVERLFKHFFEIAVIDVDQYDKDYIFRVPVVIYNNNILGEGNLKSGKLILNLIRYLVF